MVARTAIRTGNPPIANTGIAHWFMASAGVRKSMFKKGRRMKTKNINLPSLFGALVCTRTSVFDGKPCDEAEEVSFVRVDRRTVDCPMKNRYIGEKWYEDGRNHRVENGKIARDFDDKRWVVQVPDGAALQEFCLKYDEIILSINNDGLEPCFEVEIYDTYRE